MHGNIKSFEKPFTHAEVVALAESMLKRFGGDRHVAGSCARSDAITAFKARVVSCVE